VQALLYGLYLAGFVMAGMFCITWFPLAFRALRRDRAEVSVAKIFDYAGVMLALFLSFGLILRNLHLYGTTDYREPLSLIGRVALPLVLDAMIALRLVRWLHYLRAHRGEPDTAKDLLVGVSKTPDSTDPPP
jgi:hypothetical protein